ncbi:MAG: hypothetical protein KGJ23_12670 [Euryarchaeota archaeon]|nr:hypothetical protein [Euryarchaeota archaeon]MDE1837452.1 hypothetical protein [Euryarchaeota archaeon]MDE1881875.1 hypothetical protein [Euryarchaeota archaeon]MDE2045582.1 hypothetical protein [Thermoplasmata archaeon]
MIAQPKFLVSDRFEIERFVTTDTDIVDFFKDTPADEVAERLETVLRVGVAALRTADLAQNVQMVERKFGELNQAFEKSLEKNLGEDSEFVRLLVDYLGNDGKLPAQVKAAFGPEGILHQRIQELLSPHGPLVKPLLDPSNPDSPLGRFKREMIEELGKMEKKILAQQTTRKQKAGAIGATFQDELEVLLGELAKGPRDLLKRTTSEPGVLPNPDGKTARIVGDFVVRPAERVDVPIVFEAKGGKHRMTLNAIEEEMKEAVANREAKYGVFVARHVGALPAEVGWFDERWGSILIVALADDMEETPRREMLETAYRWARLRALMEKAEARTGTDLNAVRAKFQEARQVVKGVSALKSELSKSITGIRGVQDALDQLQENVGGCLDLIEKEIATAFSKPSTTPSS